MSFHMSAFDTLIEIKDETDCVTYGMAKWAAESYDLVVDFLIEYGLPGDWEDEETGEPLGVDVGELIAWINSKA
jgi:hypothetical protein